MISRADYYSHSTGRSQAHHLLRPSTNIPREGMKTSDFEVIPLCAYHHMILHSKYGTEKLFFEHYGMKENAGQLYAKQLSTGNSNLIDDDDDLPF